MRPSGEPLGSSVKLVHIPSHLSHFTCPRLPLPLSIQGSQGGTRQDSMQQLQVLGHPIPQRWPWTYIKTTAWLVRLFVCLF